MFARIVCCGTLTLQNHTLCLQTRLGLRREAGIPSRGNGRGQSMEVAMGPTDMLEGEAGVCMRAAGSFVLVCFMQVYDPELLEG